MCLNIFLGIIWVLMISIEKINTFKERWIQNFYELVNFICFYHNIILIIIEINAIQLFLYYIFF